MEHIEIRRLCEPTEQLCMLIGELDCYLSQFYEAEQRHGLAVNELFEPHVAFFIAYAGKEPVACGGIAFYEGYAELKRMYSRVWARGRGFARSLLQRLEDEGRMRGSKLLRLETGIHQPEAIRFYEQAGFRACGPFGAYAEMAPKEIALSLFYEKAL
ncbi:GNAT family N-acetyltransferase [Rhodoligotrophos ferricapiens]|uniref:GNAT family N-acetyltransferase n=1 Tax=Rhodoligotrophos ferricapiens TaxID=3069264 RepID=UPI00315CED88